MATQSGCFPELFGPTPSMAGAVAARQMTDLGKDTQAHAWRVTAVGTTARVAETGELALEPVLLVTCKDCKDGPVQN